VLRGKRVLITGAAGSVGAALANTLADFGDCELALLDHFDHGLLNIVEEVERIAPQMRATEALCDIRDRRRLGAWFERLRPELVIHAAALKHVHMGERHPGECVLTNLIGVRNVLEAAHDHGAAQVVLVSTDKAAEPVCVMGATKRLAELLLAGFAHEHAGAPSICAVRFGNIVGSQGSVVPRFAAQIAAGRPVEITHADMVRYFMTASEAVAFTLQAAALHRTQPIPATYTLELGEPVRILELAQRMISESGRAIPIRFTGLRAGEKLSEQLHDDCETTAPTDLPRVSRVTPRSADARLSTHEAAELEAAARTASDAVVKERVFALLDSKLGRNAVQSA
jgi:O-antigen biosynthesis protein WbqV